MKLIRVQTGIKREWGQEVVRVKGGRVEKERKREGEKSWRAY